MPSETQNWYYNTDPTALVRAFAVGGIILAPIGLMIGVFYLYYRACKFAWNRVINPLLGNPYVKPVSFLSEETSSSACEFDSYKEVHKRLAYKTLAK
jgi:hypothetical protein